MAKLQPIQSTATDSTPAKKTGRSFALQIDFKTVRLAAIDTMRSGLNQYQLRLNSKLLQEVTNALDGWLLEYEDEFKAQLKQASHGEKYACLERHLGGDGGDEYPLLEESTGRHGQDARRAENQATRLLTDFLLYFSQKQLLELRRLRNGNKQFRNTIAKARDDEARRKAILRYAADLGASPRQLRGDEEAFNRWFDEEAVTDRFAKRLGHIELLLAFLYDRLSLSIDHVFTLVFGNDNQSDQDFTPQDYQPLLQRLEGMWQRLDLESRTHDALQYEGDVRVKVAALKCLNLATRRLPAVLTKKLFSKRTAVILHRTAIESRDDVWVQCESFSILANLDMDRTLPIIMQRLRHPLAGDDMFVRRHLYRLLAARLKSGQNADLDLPPHQNEPSEFVRQAFCQVAFLSTNESTYRQWMDMALGDPTLQVRAAALLVGTQFPCDTAKEIDFLQVIHQVLENDTDDFVLRTAMHVITTTMKSIAEIDSPVATTDHVSEEEVRQATIFKFYAQRIRKQLMRLQHDHESQPVRRWAAQTRETCWVILDPQARELLKRVREITPSIPIGETKRLPKQWFVDVDDVKLGRIFAVLSQDDFGYDINKGLFGSVHVTRGPTFGFRLWRLIFECTHTATDKRQALRHTVGRINSAAIRAPSQILGELSETKVPGEPLTIGKDSTWRPFLPLPDDFVSVLNRSWLFPRTTTFFTSQGVTRVTGPKGLFRRLRAAFQLNFNFAELSSKRNWNDDTYPSSSYIDDMRGLGFTIAFNEYDTENSADSYRAPCSDSPSEQQRCDAPIQDAPAPLCAPPPLCPPASVDETVSQFFTPTLSVTPLLAAAMLDSIAKSFMEYAAYFESAFENSVEELVVFTAVVLLIILAKHFWANYTLRRARRSIPLSIGGWGTRGKSGTERLKAALIGAMGHGLVSKTTGCEAMFIHADPNGEPLEIPLFRPFDKATIWEQHNLILMTARMNPSVFLWECMALTPSYVDVLQRQWTSDDMGTITNTYPDHEDLQGPAGHDVATTISGFVPVKSHLITTEQMMRPYIAESCRSADTTLRGVGWLESGLVTDDVLDRFPYKEHPDNVALVAAMGDELGVDYDVAVKAMGDYLVPDLGVLKTHPISTVRTRKIEFTNGMSANERFGCMGNISRLGFDTQDPWDAPSTWVSGVVNNRADRVPRSKVFAKIIVEDMNADRFFLIGSNLKGLRGFIEEAWDERAATITLRDQGKPWDTTVALNILRKAAWNFRQPIEASHVTEKLSVMLKAIREDDRTDATISTDEMVLHWDAPDALRQALEQAGVPVALVDSVCKQHKQAYTALREYEEMCQTIHNGTQVTAESIESEYRQLLQSWYMRKLVVIENFDATGEEVIAKIVDETPPGFLNRTIGLQNIKGTGLDFVYRFQAWDFCFEACLATLSSKPQIAERGLQALIAMPAIGQLCHNRMREVIDAARESKALRRPDLQAQIAQLDARLNVASNQTAKKADDTSDLNPAGKPGRSRAESLAAWNKWMLDTSEEAIDLNDSLRRRDNADRIYKDLAAQRISRQRAIVELRKINKRQKGGWLTSKLQSK